MKNSTIFMRCGDAHQGQKRKRSSVSPPQRGHSRERRIAVDVVPLGALRQGSNDVLRGPDLRVAAAEIDQGLAAVSRRRGNPGQQRGEVLLRKTMQSLWARGHPATLSGGSLRSTQLDG
jgi:hypothetical protein